MTALSFPSHHIDDHSRGAGAASLRCGGDCDHRHVGFYEPAETHSSLWRFPKRRQLGGAKISRSTTFYSVIRGGSLAHEGDRLNGHSSPVGLVATLIRGGASLRWAGRMRALHGAALRSRFLNRQFQSAHHIACKLADGVFL